MKNGEWTFDEDIPISATKKPGRKVGSHSVDRMRVGNSRFFPEPQRKVGGRFATLAKKRPGWKFVTRQVVEDGVAGTRVWRIA